MGVRFHREPQLENPALMASRPGIGDIGILAVNTLTETLEAEKFAETEPRVLFYPKEVVIRGGILEHLEFPGNRFYFKRIQ